MGIRNSSHTYALLTVVLWSVSYVFTRIALRYFSPLPLGFLRYITASVALIVVVLALRLGLPPKRALGWILLSGALGFFLYMVAFNTGSSTVTAATSCTVIASVPVITALLARIIYRERLTGLQYVSIAISFAGVVILTVMDLSLDGGTGILWILGAAVLLSLYNLVQRRLTKICKPLVSTAYSIFAGTLMLSVFAPKAVTELPGAPVTALLCVAALGILCGAVAYCSWTKALSLTKNTSSVSNYMFLEPFLTAILGVLIAGEALEARTIIGGAVIIAGLALYSFGARLIRVRAK